MFLDLIKRIVNSKLVSNVLSAKGLFRLIVNNGLVVFIYHEVSDNPSEFHSRYGLNVPPEIFENQIRFIKDLFNVITPADLLSENYKKPAAMVTFDDGPKGYYDNAVPILNKLNCPSTIFLNMGPINGDIFWAGLVTFLCDNDKEFVNSVIHDGTKKYKQPYYLYLSPHDIEKYLAKKDRNEIFMKAKKYYGEFISHEQLRKCSGNRLITFGNHLYNHYNCAILTDEEISRAFTKNQKEINKFSNSTNLFSYPFGQKESCYTDKTNAIVDQLGAERIFTANPINFSPNGKVIHRVGIISKIIEEKQLRSYLVKRRLSQIVSAFG